MALDDIGRQIDGAPLTEVSPEPLEVAPRRSHGSVLIELVQ
jgi:hypothetical protein